MCSLWLSGYGEDKPLVTHVKTLNAARKAAATANKDFYTTSVRYIYLLLFHRRLMFLRAWCTVEIPQFFGFEPRHLQATHADSPF